ncbi:MAG: TusE/DsrC/DsvC family sulfur relay protein [bacterium]
MAYQLNGKTIECNENGYLDNLEDWNKDVAELIADAEGLQLEERSWDIINYLRDEYINNNQNQPNDRNIVKTMSKLWGEKLTAKDIYKFFPKNPSKQAGKVAGLPESRRKGGY